MTSPNEPASISPPPYSPQPVPSYSSTANNTTANTTKPARNPPPPIDLLLLGSPNTGKSTFLSRLPQLSHGPITASTPFPTSKFDLTNPRPHTYTVSLFRRPYTINIYPSTTPLFTDPFPPDPKFVIITYDITSRASLHNARYYWRRQFTAHYPEIESETPVMLLGLKRDLRNENIEEDGEEKGKTVCIMPQEGVEVAGLMRCDRYAECSALTGDLLWEVVEDITRMAAMTTVEGGGQSRGVECCLM